MTDIDEAIVKLASILAAYRFVARHESDLQEQIANVLAGQPGVLALDREVAAANGRYDILVKMLGVDRNPTIVLELKVDGSASAVERQAQKYAVTDGVDAVVVVTSSNRLAARLLEVGGGAGTLGGKPFRVIRVGTFL